MKNALVWILLICFDAFSAQQLRFKHITSEEGLSTNFVRTIIQDDRGFMWFGTQDGLNKYDGCQITVFKHDPTNPNSISNSEITSLLQAHESLILVGTRYGLNFFDPVTGRFTFLSNVDKRLQGRINVIFRLDSLNILIGSEEGLFELNLKTRQIKNPFFSKQEKINVKAIKSIDDAVYIGTMGNGLWKLSRSNKLESLAITTPDYIKLKPGATESITHIEEYGGKIYLGTAGFGILKVDRLFEVESQISFVEQNENSNMIRDFVIRNNKVFVASAYGILVYNLITENVNLYIKHEKPFSLNSNPCNCIFIDNQQNFWIGTDLGGVNISFFRSQKFPNSAFNYETDHTNLYAFYETTPGSLLIGGVETLKELDLETGRTVNHSQLIGTGTALSIAREDEDVFWIGTWGNGVYRYNKKTKQSRNILSNKSGGTILCLFADGGYMYAGSVGDGLFRINTTTFEVKRYTEKEGLPNQSVNTIFRDSKKQVWIGTYDGGLLKLKDLSGDSVLRISKVYRNMGKPGDIASNVVFAVNEDKGGNIWVATSTGLSKLRPDGTFYNFYEKDGLANTYLYSLLKDSLDNFWMSSNGGLIRFNPLLTEKEIAFKNYGIKDGLVNTEYNMGAAFVSPPGNMYFGGAKGFNSFRPTKIKDNLHAPKAYIINYKRAGQDVETDSLITYKKYLRLNWRENYFQFEVVALDYTDPTKNKFRYKLEGYDADWSAPTSVRFVSYTQLPGGEYTFRVRAANNDGIWNENSTDISITVIPPFWKTNAFYFIVLVLGLGSIYMFTQYRTRAIMRENRILEQKVAERTRELEEKNNDILSSIQYAKRIQEAILPSKNNIFRKLKKVFILYRPKDIVSGDFYWFAEKDGIKIFAVVDCTGHGVPGAFMSMIGHNLLHQIVLEKGILDPGEILTNLHKGVQDALRQGHNEINTNDGMDVSLITINDREREARWAGANRPLIMIDSNGNFVKYDGNKFPVGGAQAEGTRIFTTHVIPVLISSMAYMFSDGYADQFGGDKGKKFMVKRFHELLATIHLLSAEEQRKELEHHFDQWRKNHEQVDDVLIVGIEI